MDKIFDVKTVRRMLDLADDVFDSKDMKPRMYEYKGVWFSDTVVQTRTLDILRNWKARTDDVFIVTYPKSGTTWTQEIMYLALNGGKVEKVNEGHTFMRVPQLEIQMDLRPQGQLRWFSNALKILMLLWCMLQLTFQFLWHCFKTKSFLVSMSTIEMIGTIPSPRLLKCHLPEHLLPPDIFKKKAKIVYVARNPKDVAVSYYHFHRLTPVIPKYDSWDTFFDDFLAGKVSWGNWYEHNLGYWKRRHEENILFLQYEDMKRDKKAAVKRICEFLGYHYSDDILDRITEHTSFNSMKKNTMSNPDSLILRRDEDKELSFMRKGEIGDWKNYFTDAQNEAFNALYEEKLAGTGLEFQFE